VSPSTLSLTGTAAGQLTATVSDRCGDLEAMTILPFGPEEARIAADIRQQIEGQGQPIGMADYMIAAVCIATNSILLTRNRKHLERVKDLKLSGCAMSER
jgi:tRNA(fMet)-specific endonuclease VapC